MIAGTQAKCQSDVGFTKDTPYLALTGEIWGVFCEYFWENSPRYDGTALYFVESLPFIIMGFLCIFSMFSSLLSPAVWCRVALHDARKTAFCRGRSFPSVTRKTDVTKWKKNTSDILSLSLVKTLAILMNSFNSLWPSDVLHIMKLRQAGVAVLIFVYSFVLNQIKQL